MPEWLVTYFQSLSKEQKIHLVAWLDSLDPYELIDEIAESLGQSLGRIEEVDNE